jgi:ribosomal-protein-serine acetyltransferase
MKALPCNWDFPASKLLMPHRDTRLELRLLQATDAPELLAAMLESQQELRRFIPLAHQPLTLDSQVERISNCLRNTHQRFGLFQAGQERLLAVGALLARVPLNPAGREIGFWTRTAEVGRGLARLMTKVLTIYAIERVESDRVQLVHNAENTASRAVIEGCGFVREGTLRNFLPKPTDQQVADGMSTSTDAVCYSLTPEEARQLSWYVELRQQIQVFDQLGNDRGFLLASPA